MSKQPIDFQPKIMFLTVLWSVTVITDFEYTTPVPNSYLNPIWPTSIHYCQCNQSGPEEKLKAGCKCLKILWLVHKDESWPPNDLNPCLGFSRDYQTHFNLVFMTRVSFFLWYCNKQHNHGTFRALKYPTRKVFRSIMLFAKEHLLSVAGFTIKRQTLYVLGLMFRYKL